MNDTLRDEVIKEIVAAFSGVSRRGITLHEAEVVDRCGSASERRAARARDAEKCWQNVPDKDIESHPTALSFLCPESFSYYIAAYMVWTLRHYRTSDSSSVDFTIYALTPNTNKPGTKWKLSRFAALSHQQAQAVRQFLKFMAENSDGCADDTAAKLALEAYWDEHGKAV